MSTYNVPIYNALMQYAGSKPTAFHMPGHKLGKGIPAGFNRELALLDVTEIPGTDNLHWPRGVIKEAQDLAAKAFGADNTFFLVNGSTCGVHAMIMTVCRPGDKLIVARDCHKSVISGMMLAGVNPVYIKPEYNTTFGITAAVLPSDVERAVIENPDAAGVLITRPNYYGICSDIREIAAITQSFGKVLMVDEAHGAHLVFNENLPESSMEAGADICVQSAHKTLPAFTQGAYLHVKSGKTDLDRLKFVLGALQTSSPSYVLMAYLDIARAVMEEEGRERLEELLEGISKFDDTLSSRSDLTLLKGRHLKNGELDRTRMVINTAKAGIRGYKAEEELRRSYNIQVEMSDINNIVCITTMADRAEDFERLAQALKDLSKGFNKSRELADIIIRELSIPHQAMTLKEAFTAEGEFRKLRDAVGKVSLQMATPYPPGIPVVCPGEIITGEMVEYLYGILDLGGNVTGLSENLEIKVAC